MKFNFGIFTEVGYVGTSSSRFPSDKPISVTNSINPTPSSPQETTFSSSQTTYNNERPSPTYSNNLPANEQSRPDHSSTIYVNRPSPTENQNSQNTYSQSPQYIPSTGQLPQNNGDKYSTQNTFSTDDRYSSKPTSYGTSNAQPYDNNFTTNGPTYSNTLATNQNGKYPSNDIHTYTSTSQDKFNFYHDIGPIYQYPMLYEHNYPQPNDNRDNYPNVYAQNVPTVDGNYYRPTSSSAAFPTASTTNVAHSSIGTYSPSSSYDRPSQIKPTYMTPITSKPGFVSTGNDAGNGYSQKPVMNSNGMPGNDNSYFYYDASGNDENQTMISCGDGVIDVVGTGENMYNKNRSHHNGKHNSHRFDVENSYSNGHMKPIQTYFNPDDYYYEYTKCKYFLFSNTLHYTLLILICSKQYVLILC